MKEALDEMEQKKLEKFGEDIYKYQKFNTKTILKKIDTDYAEETARYYINSGISYIKTGTVYKSVPKTIWQAIDKAKANCVQPLRPAIGEERMERNRIYQKKDAKLPVMNNPIVKQKTTEIFGYGVRIENRIILFDNEHSMATFIKNAKFVNPDIELQPVTVECENYER